MVEINLEECFQEDFSGWNKIEREILDPNKRAHGEKFNEHVHEMLDSILLKSTAQNTSISTVAHKELEQIDQDISFVLNKFLKKIDVQKRGFPIQKRK